LQNVLNRFHLLQRMNYKLIKVLHVEKIERCRERAAQMEAHSVGLIPGVVFSITIVRDSYQTFDQIAIKSYDVIVIHEQLDGFSAHETSQIIRSGDQTIPLLQLALPGDSSIEYKLSCLQRTGFSHLLVEPYSDDDYFWAVAAMCHVQSPGATQSEESKPKTNEMKAIVHLALERYLEACRLRSDSDMEMVS
jgi:CheY-like chemotaxis protein